MKTEKVIFSLICLLMYVHSPGQDIRVNLYNSMAVKNLVLSAYNRDLTAYENDRLSFRITQGDGVYITEHNGKLLVNNKNGVLGSFNQLTVSGSDTASLVRLKPISDRAEARNYEGIIHLYPVNGRIRMLNQINTEHYIAGVVEAEVGRGRMPEFYKAKAVICRTYLYGHITRHSAEGSHLCDETHCQVYKGQCKDRELICKSVYQTKGIILTDKTNSKPILAAYHSNCGGETESAKNAWQNDMPYLVPVSDPYCVSQKNATWKKTIPFDDWLSYLIDKGFKINPWVVTDFDYQQLTRISGYKVNDFYLSSKQIRSDLDLRSSFFSVTLDNDKVLLEGKGYGHGVGLCQEGAMEMGRRGFKYDEIISFYYKYVNLVPVSSLEIKVPEFPRDWPYEPISKK